MSKTKAPKYPPPPPTSTDPFAMPPDRLVMLMQCCEAETAFAAYHVKSQVMNIWKKLEPTIAPGKKGYAFKLVSVAIVHSFKQGFKKAGGGMPDE